jgi:peptidoglycan L-alanyl-D-glutamate endopeptidase CwlK
MPKLSKRSLDRLCTCNSKLIALFTHAIENSPVDFTILEGFRDKERQNELYAEGKSQLKFPNGNHNRYPSHAVDIVPCAPIDWDDLDRFKELAGYIKGEAIHLGIGVAWGGNWKKFRDYPHWELT